MADDITVNTIAGSPVVATDDIAGRHYQIAKLAHGALDSATIVSTASGLPVQQQGTWNIGSITTLPALVTGSATIGAVTGPTADNAANPTLKLGVLPAVALAAAPTRTEGNVNPLRVTLAGDAVVTLDGEAIVLGAGTANIGDVDVLTIAAGDNNIGNVDIVTISEVADGDLPTAVADAAAVRAWFSRHGEIHVRSGYQSAAGTVWELDEAPAANTQATETKAAGAAGVRHVATGIQCTLASNGTAPTAIELNVVLRDGAAGVGTIIWEISLSIPNTAGVVNGIALTGLWIVGTAATAMTLEFTAAGGAQTFEAVNIQGTSITE